MLGFRTNRTSDMLIKYTRQHIITKDALLIIIKLTTMMVVVAELDEDFVCDSSVTKGFRTSKYQGLHMMIFNIYLQYFACNFARIRVLASFSQCLKQYIESHREDRHCIQWDWRRNSLQPLGPPAIASRLGRGLASMLLRNPILEDTITTLYSLIIDACVDFQRPNQSLSQHLLLLGSFQCLASTKVSLYTYVFCIYDTPFL